MTSPAQPSQVKQLSPDGLHLPQNFDELPSVEGAHAATLAVKALGAQGAFIGLGARYQQVVVRRAILPKPQPVTKLAFV